MSHAFQREQFQTPLRCPQCAATGTALWEEHSAPNPEGPRSVLVRLTGTFHLLSPRNRYGQPEIACSACGTVQPD